MKRTAHQPHSYCHACGSANLAWNPERNTAQCEDCKEYTYLNPLPVVNLIIPHDNGIFLQRRNIEPGRGKISLPGGFMMRGETWRTAAAREAWEEIQVHIHNPEKVIKHLLTESIPNGNQVIIFGVLAPCACVRVDEFVPSSEVTGRIHVTRRSLWSDRLSIAFPLHTEAIDKYFGTD